MKLGGSSEPTPEAPAAPIDTPPADAGMDAEPTPSSDDKPFDKEPFNAGVEADENSDPKKYIEQLTGKLGQSLRKYTESQGQPDYELEKFSINSLLSATHTSEMDANDQSDIIKKVKTAGNKDDDNSDAADTDVDPNNDDAESPDLGDGGSENAGAANAGASGGDFGGDVNESKTQVEKDNPTLYPDGWKEMDGIFMNPKKNNMFQPNSNDILDNHLKESEKSSIFGKIKTKLRETFNQVDDMNEPMIEPQVMPKPSTKPAPTKVEPNIAPSRKNKPFLPMPSVKPDPKASK